MSILVRSVLPIISRTKYTNVSFMPDLSGTISTSR